ncbi:MAG: diacylglycerol kinase family protein [Polyangiaceae bacterium]
MRVVAVVNEKARRGGPRVARQFSAALPAAEVILTRSLDEVERLAKDFASSPPDLVLGAGGDGTAVALLNSVRNARTSLAARGGRPHSGSLLRLGLVKLGTGNGLANVVGAPSVSRSLSLLRRAMERGGAWSSDRSARVTHRGLPLRRFDLVEVEGCVAHFAGTGWDAELIDDFHAQKTEPSVLPPRMRYGLAGYLNGLMTRAVPRNLRLPRVEVEVHNTGKVALGVDARKQPFDIAGTGAGQAHSMLYRGPVSVCGVGTSSEWGFGFKAFPFADLVPGRFNLRMFVGTTGEALRRVPLLWSGKHPLDKMLTWLLTAAEVRLSRQVPFQIGGDLLGHRDVIQYAISSDRVDVLDWAALSAELDPVPRGFLAHATQPLEASLRTMVR